MRDRIADLRPDRIARIAGLNYLIIIFAGVFAEFFVRSQLIVSGDPAATASNITGSETLFRFGIALDLVMIGADLIVAVALYALLRPINRHLALLTALFRVVMDSILGLNLLNLLAALMLLDGSAGGSGFAPADLQSGAMVLLDAHALGYSIALIPFGFGTMIVSYLLYKSNFVPRIVALMLGLAAAVYLSGSFLHILAPEAYETFEVAYAVPFVAELALALWLTFKGVRIPSGRAQLSAATA